MEAPKGTHTQNECVRGRTMWCRVGNEGVVELVLIGEVNGCEKAYGRRSGNVRTTAGFGQSSPM